MLRSVVRQAQIAAHWEGRHQGARGLQGNRLMPERLNIHADSGNPCGFDGARNVSNGHMAQRSAGGQEDGVNAILLYLLGPLRGKLIAQARDVGQAKKRVGDGRQFANLARCLKLLKASERE